ncbi:CD209 antigen-like protein E [Stegastes partitus]|uniref:CD209 antigen-like protein E n=1 Tax=Stegastes partitus TaxID=144197 RepID=A0A3B5AGF5_9TELE|nr:PREDICTED: CD209 antigen-like protein E [Stegastes partitus]XP_008281261.1 PREDICTED: CD209 antigen-like protein E [Stegastes partitus]
MERTGCNSDGGFNALISQEDMEEHPPYQQFGQGSQQVSMFSMNPGRRCRLAVAILALLAAVLLIVDISLGVHYNKLTDTHLTLDDTERITKEAMALQDTYKAAVQTMKGAEKQLDSEMSRQKQTNWEFEHQTKRSQDYEAQIEKIRKELVALRSQLPMINDGCKHCPAGWILMNSVCYYFSFSDSAGLKSWEKSREFCQMYGGDLVVIDSKDKQNSTVNYMINHHDSSQQNLGYWMGLRDFHEEGTWKWLDGTVLVEGYWNDGEPNDSGNEDCATVLAAENFFKAWNDLSCRKQQRWICEKAPTSMS